MRVALVHYHLRPGGVTRVIRNAAVLLAERGVKTVVLAGEPAPEPWPVPVAVVPGLGYRTAQCNAADGAMLATALREAAASMGEGKGGAPDVWHFHNHNLGKNVSLPFALDSLFAEGAAVVLQIHDFAEDGRPQGYEVLKPALNAVPGGIYPSCANAHYAVINRRDAAVLTGAGADPARVHYLPHPAAILDMAGADAGAAPGFLPMQNRVSAVDGPIAFAPVRGIRRKNVGELALLSLLDPDSAAYVTSLAVRDGGSAAIHAEWERYVAEHDLRVVLGGAEPVGCAECARVARNFVTASVSEGFGLISLESILFMRPLAGRRLREVNPLGADAGPALYDCLRIPTEWIAAEMLQARIGDAMRRMWASYGRQPDSEDIRVASAAVSDDAGTDFGGLDEELQRTVLARVRRPEGRDAVADLNPELNLRGAPVAGNQPADVLDRFSTSRYAGLLLALYEACARDAGASVPRRVEALSREAILDAFLAPARFRLLLA